ncbi:MAG TPA: DUF1440 domain-containing protein [Anaerolineaceae bacterium]|nr:DUF1440 domain-containing protein [Anaerolineaceae bacterium]
MIREETVREGAIRVVTYQQPNRVLPRLLAGAFAGLVASGPMALMMAGLKRTLPKREQYALPPRLITEELIERTGMDEKIDDESDISAATWLAHFGYGALGGGLYPFVFGKMRTPTLLKGAVFGLSVWLGSYMGWLPAAKIMPPATRLPMRRNLIMVASHLLWGSMVALLVDWLEEVV